MNNRIKIIFHLLVFILLVLLVKISYLAITSYLSCLVFCLYICVILYEKPMLGIKFFSIIFSIFLTILGLAMIELGKSTYLPELDCLSFYAGSIPLYILAWWLFVACLYLFEIFYKYKSNEYNKNIDIIILFTVITTIIYFGLFYQVIDKPAFLLGVDRFAYNRLNPLSNFWEKLDHIAWMLVIFQITLIVHKKYILGFISICLYILYYLWNGNKFGPFFNIIVVFCLVFASAYMLKDIKKLRKMLMNLFILSVCIVFFTFGIVASSGVDLENYIWERTSQQGQLWWKTYEITDGVVHADEFDKEIKVMFDKPIIGEGMLGADTGIYKIMYLCAPKSIIDAKLETGSRYTEAGMAAAYYYFGMYGVLIFAILMGIMFSITVNAIIRSIYVGNIIVAFLLLRLMNIELTSISMFTFVDLFKPISLLSYFYILYMWNKVPYISLKGQLKIGLRRINE